MPKALIFEVSTDVPVDVSQVWKVLGDFGTEHTWTRSLVHCERDTTEVRVGTSRTCVLPRPLMGRSQVRETLTDYKKDAELTYLLDGPAGPFAQASSRWAVRQKSPATSAASTTVTVEGRLVPRNLAVRLLLWPMVKPVLRRTTRGVLTELRDYVTASQPPSPAAR